MKHFTFTIQNGEICVCNAHENKPAAMAEYHTELAYRHDSRTSTTCIVINANGDIVAHETYIAAPPAPAPEPDGGEEE